MSKKFESWAQLLGWLDGQGMFHMELGLARMDDGLARLELASPDFAVCQVLGTNGKGSTCAFLASLCRAAGLVTGLYTSPHFLSPLERCNINGANASQEDWLRAANEIVELIPTWQNLTYFEFVTLVAMIIFRQAKCQVVILEAGLGGKNDATSAVLPTLQCFTPIAMDHAQVIGPTLSDIAKDKAAAMRPFVPVFSAPQFPAVKKALEHAARACEAPLKFCQPWHMLPGARMKGNFQRENMGVAVAAAQTIWHSLQIKPMPEEKIDMALANAFIPGRRQIVRAASTHPPLLLDGGHNPHAVIRGVSQSEEEPATVIFSCLADKDWRPGLGMLSKRYPHARFIVPQLYNSRAANAEGIAAWLKSVNPENAHSVSVADSVASAIAAANAANPAGLALVTGSFFLLAEVYALYPEYLAIRESV